MRCEQPVSGQRPERGHDVVGSGLIVLGQVVTHDVASLVLDAGHELLQLQKHQAPVGAQLHHIALDLFGYAAHHLGPLQHGDDVPDGHQILHFESGEIVGDAVEPDPVPLERLEGLVASA